MPDRIRTCNLRLRRPTLYPIELRARLRPRNFADYTVRGEPVYPRTFGVTTRGCAFRGGWGQPRVHPIPRWRVISRPQRSRGERKSSPLAKTSGRVAWPDLTSGLHQQFCLRQSTGPGRPVNPEPLRHNAMSSPPRSRLERQWTLPPDGWPGQARATFGPHRDDPRQGAAHEHAMRSQCESRSLF
jgi:hypothetical protein